MAEPKKQVESLVKPHRRRVSSGILLLAGLVVISVITMFRMPNLSQSIDYSIHFGVNVTKYHDEEPVNHMRSHMVEEEGPRSNVVVFVTNERYGSAVAASTISLRKDGGYQDDIAVIVDEGGHFNISSLQREIREMKGSLDNITFYKTTDLWDSLVGSHNESAVSYLRDAPPAPQCSSDHRKRGHPAYYLKTLIYHPAIADKWDYVLFVDSCMTFHSPHLHEIFQMKEIRGHVLAAPDPWIYGRKMLGGQVMECADKEAVKLATTYVGQDLEVSSYFTTGFVLYDSHIIRNHGESSSATILELLKLYHEIGTVFPGDQFITSVYWVYLRKQYQIIPYGLFGSPRVPYEFIKRMPNEQYIVTAGNVDRTICKSRPTARREIVSNKIKARQKISSS
jgi:hypothetical protein